MASRKEIIEHLKEAYDADESRSLCGQIRVLFDDIQALRDGGMSLGAIADALTERNIKISVATLTNCIWRIRSKRSKAGEVTERKRKPVSVGGLVAVPPLNLATQRPTMTGKLRNREDFAKQFEQNGAGGPLDKYRK